MKVIIWFTARGMAEASIQKITPFYKMWISQDLIVHFINNIIQPAQLTCSGSFSFLYMLSLAQISSKWKTLEAKYVCILFKREYLAFPSRQRFRLNKPLLENYSKSFIGQIMQITLFIVKNEILCNLLAPVVCVETDVS